MIKDNYDRLKLEVSPKTLIAVTKYMSDEQLMELYRAGCRDFAESRLDSLQRRSIMNELYDVRWHFIGRLQSNKMKKIVTTRNLFAIHAVDSEKQVEQLYSYASLLDHPLSIFIQVNKLLEKAKGGLTSLEKLQVLYDSIQLNKESNISLIGLMAMSSSSELEYESKAHLCFKTLKQWRDQIDKNLKLSAGMSDDYKIALEYGTDFVRLGSILSTN